MYQNSSESLNLSKDHLKLEKEMFARLPSIKVLCSIIHNCTDHCFQNYNHLLFSINNQMRIPGQAGFPYCADCHDLLHAENLPAIYMDSAGHGGVWCINCHGATHTNFTPPFGLNNCQACHTIQATMPTMGPECGLCHGSSVSPHLVL